MASTSYGLRNKRFPPRNQVDWLSREQRAKHRRTIKTLSDIVLAIEEDTPLSENQQQTLELIAGSDARDTQINAVFDILDKTESGYMKKLCAMAPHDLSAYHEFMNPHEPPAHHHYFMCDHLMKVEEGKSKTFILAISPGAAKTSYASRSFAQWYMGRNPDKRVLALGNTQKFIEDEISKPNRTALEDPKYQAVFPDVALSISEKSASFWRLQDHRGSYACRGAMAGTAGLRANLILGDDLYKNAADASSPTVLNNIWRWWGADVMSRRLPGCPIVLVNCLVGDSPVLMSDGSWKRIDEIRIGDRVMSHKDGEMIAQRVSNWAEQAEDDILEVHTGNGEVRCNARHPFWARKYRYKGKWDAPAWIKAEDLQVYDKVLHSATLPENVEDSPRLTEDEAWILGLAFGDGCVSQSTGRSGNQQLITRISTSNLAEDYTFVRERFTKVFGVEPRLIQQKVVGGTSTRLETNVLRVGRWFDSNGVKIAGNAHTKRVPSWMFSQPLSIRKSFVEGMLYADGSMLTDKQHVLTLCNRNLVIDFRHMLRSIGKKVTTVRKYTQTSTLPGKEELFTSTRYRVTFAPNTNVDAPFYWKGVTKVVHTGYKEKVYDIEVENTHNFISDTIVVSNTLWSSQDVPNRLKTMYEENPNSLPAPFVFINIPAQAEEEDPLGRAPGEWLWCKDQQEDGFYTINDYETKRSITSPSLWSALYLGKPLDQQGHYIAEDQFGRYDRPPVNMPGQPVQWTKTVLTADTAAKGNERSDYTAILIFRVGVDGTHYVVDAWRGKENLERIIQVMAKMMRLWQVNYGIVEDSGMGTQIIQNYAGKMPSPVLAYSPSGRGSKDFRFDAATPWITSGRILFPQQAPWLNDVINEMVSFPSGINDDWCDAFAQYTDHELKVRRGGTKPLTLRG